MCETPPAACHAGIYVCVYIYRCIYMYIYIRTHIHSCTYVYRGSPCSVSRWEYMACIVMFVCVCVYICFCA